MSGSVAANCEGAAKWQIVSAQGSSVASGETPCNACSSASLFAYTAGSSPLVPGTYTVTASFSKGHSVVSTSSSSFTVSSGQPSAGIFLAASIPMVALAFLVTGREVKKGNADRRTVSG